MTDRKKGRPALSLAVKKSKNHTVRITVKMSSDYKKACDYYGTTMSKDTIMNIERLINLYRAESGDYENNDL